MAEGRKKHEDHHFGFFWPTADAWTLQPPTSSTFHSSGTFLCRCRAAKTAYVCHRGLLHPGFSRRCTSSSSSRYTSSGTRRVLPIPHPPPRRGRARRSWRRSRTAAGGCRRRTRSRQSPPLRNFAHGIIIIDSSVFLTWTARKMLKSSQRRRYTAKNRPQLRLLMHPLVRS